MSLMGLRWAVAGDYYIFKYIDPARYKIYEQNNKLIIESTLAMIGEERKLANLVEEENKAVKDGLKERADADKAIKDAEEGIIAKAKVELDVLLEQLNKSSNFCLDSTRTYRITDFVKVDDGGAQEGNGFYSMGLHISLPKDFQIKQEDLEIMSKLAELAKINDCAKDILKSSEDLNDWGNIYCILEAIIKDTGGFGWIIGLKIPTLDSVARIKHFKHSAQPDRHANSKPVYGRVTISDAETSIKKLVREWVKKK